MSNSTALSIINKAKAGGALTFVGQGVTETVPLYKLEATELEVKPDNFHSIQGKLVFKKEVCDRIADASGISFTMADCTSERAPEEPGIGLPARTIFVGRAQGKTRLPDGSWRESAPETYAFDYTAKARAEAGTDEVKFRKLAMEYYKAGPMRAATGARLRVIRQLTGMPTAFPPSDIGQRKVFVFSRIVQNTDYILSTPEGRSMAIAMATGAAEMMYGKQLAAQAPEQASQAPEPRNVTPEQTDEWPEDNEDPRIGQIMQLLSDWALVEDQRVAKRAQALIDRGEMRIPVLESALAVIQYMGSGATQGLKNCADALDMDPLDPIVLSSLAAKVKGSAA